MKITQHSVLGFPFWFSVFLQAGQSPIDFLFDFVEESQGPFEGYDALDTRPRAGRENQNKVKC